MTSINPSIYQAIVIAKALRFYAKTGMPINRAYTPKNMIRMAEQITGQPFKPRDYERAATALEYWAKYTHKADKE